MSAGQMNAGESGETGALEAQAPRFVSVPGSDVAYRKVGQGPPLLMVHGYPLSGLTWRKVVPLLADRFTCYLPDLPGAGETRWSTATDFNFRGQAETLKALVRALELERYSLLGHDTGGTIARRLALIDVARVEKLVVVGTEIPGHRPPWIPLFQKTANPEMTILFRTLMRQAWFLRSSAAFGGCFYDPNLIFGEFHELFVAPLLASKRRVSGQLHYLRGIDWEVVDGMRTDHAKLTMPTLLVWGEDDPVFPVREARAMVTQLPNCAGMVTIPRAKLFVHEEQPEEVAAAVMKFLR